MTAEQLRDNDYRCGEYDCMDWNLHADRTEKVIYFRLFVYPRIRRALYLTLSVLPSVMVGLGAKSLSWVVFRFKK